MAKLFNYYLFKSSRVQIPLTLCWHPSHGPKVKKVEKERNEKGIYIMNVLVDFIIIFDDHQVHVSLSCRNQASNLVIHITLLFTKNITEAKSFNFQFLVSGLVLKNPMPSAKF